MIQYKIQFLNKLKNLNKIISISSTEYILTAAEKNNIKLPYSCKTGACSTCVCKKLKGFVKHINQSFLSNNELQKNYILPCVACPTSNLIILTHMEHELY
jgi:ferredoxin